MSHLKSNASSLAASLVPLLPHYNVQVRAFTTSTMDDAKEYIQASAPDARPAVCIALEQSSGRGRRGTPWRTDQEGITLTVAFRDSDVHIQREWCTIAVGLAIVRVLAQYTKEVQLKWPNDIVTLDGRKLSGILVEKISADWLSIGIGVNIKNAPPYAVALAALSEQHPDRVALIAQIVQAIHEILSNDPAVDLHAEVNQVLHRPGRPVPFRHGREGMLLEVVGVSTEGALIGKVRDTELTFVTGHFVKEYEV